MLWGFATAGKMGLLAEEDFLPVRLEADSCLRIVRVELSGPLHLWEFFLLIAVILTCLVVVVLIILFVIVWGHLIGALSGYAISCL